jgi:hypothetical protein
MGTTPVQHAPELINDHVGPLIVFALLALLFVVLWARMKRPSANTKCFLSVLFSMAPWLCMTGWMAIVGSWEATKHEEAGPTVWILGPSLLLWLASPVLAVLGVRDFRKSPGKYVEGKGAAFATLAQVGFFSCTFGVAMVLNHANLDERSQARAVLLVMVGTFVVGAGILMFALYKWGLPVFREWF